MAKKNSHYDMYIWGPATDCPALPGGTVCKQLFCGQVAVFGSTDGLARDWWSCTGATCNTASGNWQQACQGLQRCTFQVTDQDPLRH